MRKNTISEQSSLVFVVVVFFTFYNYTFLYIFNCATLVIESLTLVIVV